MRTIRGRLAWATAVVGLAFILSGSAAALAQSLPQATEQPSILFFLTDDQTWDSLWAMPNVQRLLVDKGVTFPNAFVVNPLCCPSRTSILTGDYSHTTDVYRQIPPHGGVATFNDTSTIATWLHDAGYTTGLIGKYVNGFQDAAARGYVPPGWDKFMAFSTPDYQNYTLDVDGAVVKYGDAPKDYSNKVLTNAADEFIRTTKGPLFLEFSTNLPHAPALPEPRFAHAFSELTPSRPPSFDEADVSDKPAYIRDLPTLTPRAVRHLDDLYRDQYRTLLSVDDSVGRLMDAMRDTGRLDNALVILMSDNGLLFGQHRWAKKEVPYEESIRVPLAIRDDQFAQAGVTDARFALNIDLAPTIADVAGVDHPQTDGTSLVPILRGDEVQWRDRFLVEHYEGSNPVPTYCALRTTKDMYVRYVDGEEELYDLASDPYELKNLAEVPADQERRVQLSASLDALCVPRPPGFGGGGVSWTGAAVAFAGVAAAAMGRRSVRRGSPSLGDRGDSVG